ncbi:MAG: UbiA family prenyltransferase [Chitinophagales bacterium]
MNLARRILSFFLYGNIFIGLCAVALVLTNQLTVGQHLWAGYVSAFVFCSTVFAYSALKFRVGTHSGTTTTHNTWADNNPITAKIILLIAGLATVILFFKLRIRAQQVTVALGVITALYGFVSVPFTGGKKLRDYGLLKTAFVGLVWSVTTVIIPLAGHGVSIEVLCFLLLRRFLFVMALTMAFEIKDIAADRAYGIKTLPMQLGVTGTKRLAQGVLLLLLVVNFMQYYLSEVSFGNIMAVNVSVLLSIACIQPLTEQTGDVWYYFVLDGMMFIQFVFVFIAYNFVR